MQDKISQQQTLYRTQKQPKSIPYVNQIRLRKSLIENIKAKHQQKVKQAQLQLQDQNLIQKVSHTQTKGVYSTQPILIKQKQLEQDLKNINVSDTDKMLFQKKFKNFLNHRQQYQEQLKRKRELIIQKRKQKQEQFDAQDFQNQYIDKQQILRDQKGQNQFTNASQMVAFYEQITFGKKNNQSQTQLYHSQKIQYLFRREQFDYLIILQIGADQNQNQKQLPTLITTIKKDTFLNYLFDQPAVMMLYSINPYALGDQLAQFQTENDGYLSFEEFSSFLLLDREPTYIQYTKENIEQARRMGRGLKCQPIIAKWVADKQLYQQLIQTFKQVDILGEQKVQKQVLARKIRKQAEKKRILDLQIIEIININKLITLDRILYELQYSESQSQKIRLQQFQAFLSKYHRLKTPPKDKLLKKLILSGKYDPSYIFILGTEAIEIIKQTFNQLPKFAQYFVKKQSFIQRIIRSEKFKKIKSQCVRSEGNRFVKKQTVQETLLRIMNQGQTYLDIQEVLDFFTNRGRPRKVEYKIYIANLEMQLARIEEEQKRKQQKKLSQGDFSTSSDDQQFQKHLRQKKTQRKKDKLAAIRASQNFTEGKKFIVTVPNPFSFGLGIKQKTKVSIRQKKLKSMLQQKKHQQNQSMKPIKPKQVPEHVKQNLYEKITKQQERERKQRLERFRLESQQRMYPISTHLLQKKKSKSVYYIQSQEHKFIAKPLPWYCEVNLLQRIQKQKDQRRQRILQEIINKHNDYDMPEGFKNMIQRGQQTQKQKQRRRALSKTTANDPNCTFNPKITQGVPDFKLIHEHFQIDIQNKKQQKQPIKVEPFSFQNRPARSYTAAQNKQENQFNLKKSKQSQHHKVSAQQDINIPITMKYEALVNLRKKQELEKQNRENQQRRAQTVRKMRQQKFAPYVRSVLRKNQVGDIGKSRAIIEQKIKQFKRQQRKKKQQYQEQMIKIYTKVFNRPLLVEGDQQRYQQQQQDNYQAHHREDRRQSNSHKRSKQRKNQQKDPRGQIQQFAQDYQMRYNPDQQYSKRQRNQEYDQMRRKAIEHPPKNYLMEQPDNNDQQNDNQEQDYEGQYLSQNGRYTN